VGLARAAQRLKELGERGVVALHDARAGIEHAAKEVPEGKAVRLARRDHVGGARAKRREIPPVPVQDGLEEERVRQAERMAGPPCKRDGVTPTHPRGVGAAEEPEVPRDVGERGDPVVGPQHAVRSALRAGSYNALADSACASDEANFPDSARPRPRSGVR
jgi:hypothetical protein